MCKLKWATTMLVVALPAYLCMNPCLVLSLGLGCHIGIALTILQVVDPKLHSCILWAQVLWPLCRVVAIWGPFPLKPKISKHGPTPQCSRCISLDCSGDGVLKGVPSE